MMRRVVMPMARRHGFTTRSSRTTHLADACHGTLHLGKNQCDCGENHQLCPKHRDLFLEG